MERGNKLDPQIHMAQKMSRKKIVFEYIAYSDFASPHHRLLLFLVVVFIEQYNKYVDR